FLCCTGGAAGSVLDDTVTKQCLLLRLIRYACPSVHVHPVTPPAADDQYSVLKEDLEADASDFESPTWSLAVDQQYIKKFSKEEIRRQDVIHELIQTEINHVRTLKLMLGVYCREVQHSLPKDEVQLERLFPCLDHLLREHQNFLNQLKQRRREYLESGSQQNYFIKHIGDILVTQFSGEQRSRLLEGYGVFCSCHTDAMNYYKELQQNSKKFQNSIKKIGQLAFVKRLGVPEGILLITQRITKYPVLVERLIKNTEANTDEHQNLVYALECIKETISLVDNQVHQYETLRDLVNRLDPKSLARMNNGQVLRRDELMQHGRSVLREGLLSWRSQNKSKVSDVVVVLLTDLLLLLQEKDQKLIFASLDGKPAVISLKKLIVRESAQSEKMIFLISTADKQADMYELYASSEKERTIWKDQIWQAIERQQSIVEVQLNLPWFSHVAEEDEEDLVDQEDFFSDRIKGFHDELCMKDAQITHLLQEKLRFFSKLAEKLTDSSALPKHLLLNGTASELQQAEQLLISAIADVEGLQHTLLTDACDLPPPPVATETALQSRRANTIAGFTKSGGGSRNSFRNRNQRPSSDPQLGELYMELSADDEVWNPPQEAHVFRQRLCKTVVGLTQKLYRLQAVVAHQDSELEILRAAQSERPARYRGNGLLAQEKQRHLEKQREELQQMQKIYNQQKQEQERWEQERQVLMKKQEELQQAEAQLAEKREALAVGRKEYQQDLERLREATRAVDKQSEELKQKEEQLKKYKKDNTISNPRASFHHSPTQVQSRGQSRGLHPTLTDELSPKHPVRPIQSQANPHERPPQVPPRKESIAISPVKTEFPIQLVSTTNQALKPNTVQQQIPTKLAVSKGKDKEKGKSKYSHHRTNSAASIEVSAVVPIKGKEGGSLRSTRTTSHRPLTQDFYTPPEHVLSTKPPTYSANTHSSRKPSQASNRTQSRKVKDNSSKEDIFYF
ncbi:hypothetical protein NFI96_015616, partial [Prochilodus magdalenae]